MSPTVISESELLDVYSVSLYDWYPSNKHLSMATWQVLAALARLIPEWFVMSQYTAHVQKGFRCVSVLVCGLAMMVVVCEYGLVGGYGSGWWVKNPNGYILYLFALLHTNLSVVQICFCAPRAVTVHMGYSLVLHKV